MRRIILGLLCGLGLLLGVSQAQQIFEPTAEIVTALSNPTLTGSVTFSGMTAKTMVYLDASKILASTAAPTNGQVLIGSTGNVPALGSLAGTANQIIVTPGAGTITLSAPQDLHTGASPTFTGLTLSGLVTLSGLLVQSGLQTVTIADDGAGTSPSATVTPTKNRVAINCQDANNCTVVMGEGGILDGQEVKLIVTSTNTVAFADTAGVSELAGAFTAGQYDSLVLLYSVDRFVELSRSNN
jgi:hypothetical protein